MNTLNVTVLPGDGVGPEITKATLSVLRATGLPFEFHHKDIGIMAERHFGVGLPEHTLESIASDGFAIKGPTATPLGEGHESYNVELRRRFDLFANLRPIATIPGVLTRYRDVPINLAICRENTEGPYNHAEVDLGDRVEVTYSVTRAGTERIARAAFEYARKRGMPLVVGHKANIFKLSGGKYWKDIVERIAKEYPDVPCSSLISDDLLRRLIQSPDQFGVVLLDNFVGDLYSDGASAFIGGPGLAPGLNIGKNVMIAEAMHGTADDIAGQGKANPTSLILSTALMLDFMGKRDAGDRVRRAVMSTILAGIHTGDIRIDNSRHIVGTEAYTQAIIERL